MLDDGVSIKKVAARCPARTEPLGARLRLEHLLQCSDLAPPGFPPQAILLVKRVASTREMSLGAVRPAMAWESGIRETIAQLYRRAQRPALGPVPATVADAVLFEDRSELLACLGIDIAARVVEQKWYWRSLLRSNAVSSSWVLLRAWSEQPRFIPAAVVRLMKWRAAARVLSVLSETEATVLISLIESEFDVSLSRRAEIDWTGRAEQRHAKHTAAERTSSNHHTAGESLRQSQTSARHSPALASLDPDLAPATAQESKPAGHERNSVSQLPSAAPWRRWQTEPGGECERLSPAIQLLLSTAIALFYAPATARSKAYRAEVRSWLGYIEQKTQNQELVFKPQTEQLRRRQPDEPLIEQRLSDQVSDAGDLGPKTPASAPLRSSASSAVRKSDSEHAAQEHWAAADRRRSSASRSNPQSTETALGAISAPPSTEQAVATGESTKSLDSAGAATQSGELEQREAESSSEHAITPDQLKPWTGVQGIETDFGGALYLINVMCWLDLPACFDEQLNLSEHIGGWGLVEMFARCLLSSGGIDFNEDDALWPLLGQLDGRRPRSEVAPGLPDSKKIPVPAAWTEQLGIDDLAPIPHAVVRRWKLGWPSRMLREWLGRVFPYVRRALAIAIGKPDIDDQTLARLILVKRARVYCTNTHLDVAMSMDSIESVIRLAGLDRNPGWQPDLMRVVSFTFD